MIFEGLDCPLCGVYSVVMGLDKLEVNFVSIEKFLIAWEATLSMMLNCGRNPRLSRYLIFSVNVSIITFSLVDEIGVAKNCVGRPII